MVVLALTTLGESTSVAQDKELGDSADFRVRVQAALRLGKSGNKEARGELERGLRDSHPAVRVACAVSLVNLGDAAAIPAIERAMAGEQTASVKASFKESIDKLRAGGKPAASAGAASEGAVTVDSAKYVVQLGTMRNMSGVGSSDLEGHMRQAARRKAGSIKGAVIIDGTDAAVLKKASDKKIPVLLVDGNLTKLTQANPPGGGVVVSANVDLSIRRVPQQVLKGTVSGAASASDGSPASTNGLNELQNRAVGGAIESAVGRVSADIATLAK
jgi:hypothetical protein